MKRKQLALRSFLFLASFMMLATSALRVSANADAFQFPLSPYSVTGYNFGELVPDGSPIYSSSDPRTHLAEDAHATAGTAVHAAADGIVKQNWVKNDYGNVVIIEHTLSDGTTKVCTLYGHLRDRPDIGQGIVSLGFVSKGQIIGYIGTTKENGGWPEHLHFGVKPGPYLGNGTPGVHCSPWAYSGYGCQRHDLPTWTKPSDFINSHSGAGSIDPANPYVDGSYTGSEIGIEASPFTTVAKAVNAANATQATIHIKPGVYHEKISTSKHIHFVVNGNGTVRIGN